MTSGQTVSMVVQAWLRTLPALAGVGVASVLPADLASWSGDVFVVETLVIPRIDPYTGVVDASSQLDVWAKRAAASSRPPWRRAGQIAEDIATACLEFREWVAPAPSALYYRQRLLSVACQGFVPVRAQAGADSVLARFLCRDLRTVQVRETT